MKSVEKFERQNTIEWNGGKGGVSLLHKEELRRK
jgi:hypothetical protein